MKLIRPSISIEIKCRVVLRQLGEMFPDDVMLAHRRGFGKLLNEKLAALSDLLRCESKDLRCDHDPALGARKKIFNQVGEHIEYEPRGSDPEYLIYRPHGTQFDKSHDVKTRIRGEHGQLSDIALVKRNRRLEEREGTRPKSYRTRMREKRREKKVAQPVKRHAAFRGKNQVKPKRKYRWPKRKFGSSR